MLEGGKRMGGDGQEEQTLGERWRRERKGRTNPGL